MLFGIQCSHLMQCLERIKLYRHIARVAFLNGRCWKTTSCKNLRTWRFYSTCNTFMTMQYVYEGSISSFSWPSTTSDYVLWGQRDRHPHDDPEHMNWAYNPYSSQVFIDFNTFIVHPVQNNCMHLNNSSLPFDTMYMDPVKNKSQSRSCHVSHTN